MVHPALRRASAPLLTATGKTLATMIPLSTTIPYGVSLFLLHSSTALAFAAPSPHLVHRIPSLSGSAALSSPPPFPSPLHRFWTPKPRHGALALRSSASTRGLVGTASPDTTKDTTQDTTGGRLGGKPLPQHPKLKTGVLSNGLRYCIMPNPKPKGRFYMNLEVHAGSMDEEEEQQGIAHFVEHSLFLGTKRFPTQKAMKSLLRRLGMAANADANAFTSFTSTTYTFSAPVRGRAKEIESPAALYGGGGLSTGGQQVVEEEEEEVTEGTEEELLGLNEDSENSIVVLELLAEMAFRAKITDEAIDLERGAVLSELADRNNVQQRSAKEYYGFVHADTVLPDRFPIGLEELIKGWTGGDLRKFYETHYFPANMCLYVAGDIDPATIEKQIQGVFGAQKNPAPIPARRLKASPGHKTEAPATTPEGFASEATKPFVEWPTRGSPVTHDFETSRGGRFKVVESAQINDVSLYMQTKSPITSTRTEPELVEDLIDSVVTMVLSFRLHALRMEMTDPDFNSIGWALSADASLQCTSNSVSVSARPEKWRKALFTALQEIGRLGEYGITAAELTQSIVTIRNHFAQQAQQRDQQTSAAWMGRVMDAVHARDQLVNADDKFAILSSLCDSLTLGMVNGRTKGNLEPFLTQLGPDSKITAFVNQPAGTADPVTQEAFLEEVAKGLQKPEAPAEVKVITELISESEIAARVTDTKPGVVSKSYDEKTRITQLVLSNGVRINHIRNDARSNEMRVRVSLLGGRTLETPASKGAQSAAAALWVNGGAGGHPAEAITRYCSMWGMSFDAACGEEASRMDIVSSSAQPGQMDRLLSLASLYLSQPDLDPNAFSRFMVRVDRAGEQQKKSLQRMTSKIFVDAMFTEAERFRHQELTGETVAGLTLQQVQETLESQLNPANMAVSVAGDFDAAELEAGLVKYFGTLQGVGPSKGDLSQVIPPEVLSAKRSIFRDPTDSEAPGAAAVEGRTFVQDESARSFQLVGFPSVGRWGTLRCAEGMDLDVAAATADFVPKNATNGEPYCQKMHVSRSLAVAVDLVQSRLFQEIREKRGLVYGISFGWRPFRHIDGGYCTVQLMPKQGEEAAALAEVKKALRDVITDGVTDEEFDAAKTPLVTKVEEMLISNSFMLQLLEDLGYPDGRKDLACARDVPQHYGALDKAQVERVMREALLPGLERMVVSLGVSAPTDPEACSSDTPAAPAAEAAEVAK